MQRLYDEHKKHTGELPIIGVKTFLAKGQEAGEVEKVELMRSTDEEKQRQLTKLRRFQERNRERLGPALERLQEKARRGDNLFAELMDTVKVCSLGQITQALFEVGGQYRRNM
jgi:isobutyryl-CoA mutase